MSRAFWHPLSVLLLTDPTSYATAGVIRMLLRAPEGTELLYAGDRMWPTITHGERVRVRAATEGMLQPGALVVASIDGIPDLLRVLRVEADEVVLAADADPTIQRAPASAILALCDRASAGPGTGRRHLRRWRLDLREALTAVPDDEEDPASTVRIKYDRQAPYYAGSSATLDTRLAQRIHEAVRAGGRILVAGSGVGRECFALAEQGWPVVGIDFAPRMVELARQEDARLGLGVRFEQADLLDHEEPEGSLAAVVFTYDVYSFLPDVDRRRRLLIKMSRWLEPEGCILLSARRSTRLYDAWILTLQWLRRKLRRDTWGQTHTRWVAPDGVLHRSFVQMHRQSTLRREVGQAGLRLGRWERGHAILKRRSGTMVPEETET